MTITTEARCSEYPAAAKAGGVAGLLPLATFRLRDRAVRRVAK